MIVKITQKINDVPPWIVQFDINKTNPISKSRINCSFYLLFISVSCSQQLFVAVIYLFLAKLEQIKNRRNDCPMLRLFNIRIVLRKVENTKGIDRSRKSKTERQ
jgi:hypothetical protein